MNKCGKGGTIFIVLIPVILIVTLVIVDTIVNFTTNKNYEKVTENILTEIMTNDEIYVEDYNEEIKRAYERKGYEEPDIVKGFWLAGIICAVLGIFFAVWI